MQDDDKQLIEWFRALPEGELTIAWDEDSIGNSFNHVLSGWLDIQVPLIETELEWGWVWTVEVGEWEIDPEAAPADNLHIDSDGEALVIERAEEILFARAIYRDGDEMDLTPQEIGRVRCNRPHTIDGATVYLENLARIESVNEVLSEWVTDATGRDDISFRFEPEIGPSARLLNVIERADEDELSGQRMVTMDLNDPQFMADFFGMELEQAEEMVAQSSQAAYDFEVQAQAMHAAQEERARELTERYLI